MSGHMIAIDKRRGVCPVGVRETWRCIFAKCMLRVTGHKATNACQDDQICAGLKEAIDGALHVVQVIWDTK